MASQAIKQFFNPTVIVMRPAILKQPQSVHWAALSNAVVFTLEAKGTGVLEYRWWWRAHSGPSSSGSGHCWEALKDCLQCSGAGTPSLTILRVSLQNEGEYKCVVTSRDQCGDLWSDVAVLSVCSPPVIKVQPRYVRGAEPKTSCVIELEAEGRAPLCSQWERKSLANEATVSTHQKILQEFSCQIRQLLNVLSLLPRLVCHSLLTDEQHQELLLLSVTDIRRADLLLQWLPHSKTNYLEEFVQCLEKDDNHQGHGELAGLLRGRMKENGWEACGRDDHHQFEGVATPRLALPCANRSAEGVYRCRVWNGDGSVTSDEAVVSFLSDDEPRFKDISRKNPEIVTSTVFDQKLGKFCKCVEIIFQCCNQREYHACLDKITSPLNDGKQGSIRHPDGSLTIVVGIFGIRKVAVVFTKQGTACEAELRKACGLFSNVKAIIGMGICYGKATLKLGDVIVSKYVIDGTDNVKVISGGAQGHGATKETKDTLYNTFCKNPSPDWEFKCEANSERNSIAHVGPILSCGFLLRDGNFVKKTLENHPHAYGGEMEGWVLYEHIQKEYPDIETISIKGVTDYGNEKKDDKWQVTAAMAAASYTHYHLENSPAYLPDEEPRPEPEL